MVLTFFFFGGAIAVTNFSAKMYGHLLKLPEKLKVARNFYSNCPKNYKLPEFKEGQCPPGPPTSYAYGHLRAVAIMIERNSRHMKCTHLNMDYSRTRMPAVAQLQHKSETLVSHFFRAKCLTSYATFLF